jgi:broad specificity phosphatase PhoE
MTQLYLVRHGENLATLTKEFSHRKVDYPLTEKGVLQAEQTARHLQGKGISAVYSSPLRRAHETAQHLAAALGQEVIVLEAFRELNVGDLEDQPPSEEAWAAHNAVLRAWRRGDLEAGFPGGENYLEMWQRVGAGFRQVVAAHPDAAIAIFAHGGVFASSVKALCPDIDLHAVLSQENHNCSISLIEAELREGRLQGQLVYWAACDHMTGEAAEFVSGVPSREFFQQNGRSGV